MREWQDQNYSLELLCHSTIISIGRAIGASPELKGLEMDIKTAYVSGSKVIMFDGSPERAEFDLSDIPVEIVTGMALGFMQRVARERSAGRVDEAPARQTAVKNMTAQVAAWRAGSLEVERASKVDLTPEETASAILDFIFSQKRARGDSRPEKEIKAAFQALPEAKRNAILTALKRPLNKFLKERLAVKRGKTDKIDW
jgi:hypothetical protein